MDLLTNYSDNTRRAAQKYLVRYVFPITLKADWRFLTIGLLAYEILTIFMPRILLTTTKQFDFNKHINH